MSSPVLVCPFDNDLIKGLKNHTLVVKLNNPRKVAEVADLVRPRNRLQAVLLESSLPLDLIPFSRDWENIPVALYAPELGNFKKFAGWLPLLKGLNIRIFLPAHVNENLTSLRILSSLHINCGLRFGPQAPDWDAVRDLLAYAAYGKTQHGAIEPFNYLISHYHPTKPTDFGPVYFDAPRHYLHLKNEKAIALTPDDLTDEKIISYNLNQLDRLKDCPEYEEKKEAWRQFFISPTDCAHCRGWRVCLGRLSAIPGSSPDTCGKMMTDLMAAADYVRALKKDEKQVWQF